MQGRGANRIVDHLIRLKKEPKVFRKLHIVTHLRVYTRNNQKLHIVTSLKVYTGRNQKLHIVTPLRVYKKKRPYE